MASTELLAFAAAFDSGWRMGLLTGLGLGTILGWLVRIVYVALERRERALETRTP